jgi:hypothetical protein
VAIGWKLCNPQKQMGFGGGDFKLWFNEPPISHVEGPQWRGQRANGGAALPNDDGVRGKGGRKSLFVMWTDKVEILEILEQGLGYLAR